MTRNEALAHRIEPASDYADAVAAALAAVLREVGPTLIEPRPADADRAVRVLGYFVETFTGLALGAIARHLTAGMRRWFGDDGVAAMRGALAGWPVPPPPCEGTTVDAVRPLVGELLARLHLRFCDVAMQTRSLAAAMPQRTMTTMMFGVLAQDSLLRDKLAEELASGWRVYGAAVTTRRYPELSPVWQQFVWQLDGRPVLTRDAVLEAGYIALVR